MLFWVSNFILPSLRLCFSKFQWGFWPERLLRSLWWHPLPPPPLLAGIYWRWTKRLLGNSYCSHIKVSDHLRGHHVSLVAPEGSLVSKLWEKYTVRKPVWGGAITENFHSIIYAVTTRMLETADFQNENTQTRSSLHICLRRLSLKNHLRVFLIKYLHLKCNHLLNSVILVPTMLGSYSILPEVLHMTTGMCMKNDQGRIQFLKGHILSENL